MPVCDIVVCGLW